MFQFPWFPLPALCVQAGVTRHDPCQVFPFGDPRIEACLAAPRGLSQPATSFIGFQRLGIHRVPFTTCRNDARARYGVLKKHDRTAPAPARTRQPKPASPHGSPLRSRTTSTGDPQRMRCRNLQSCTVCPHNQHAHPAGPDHENAVPPAGRQCQKVISQ
jgi:hypothetical protein